MDFHVNKWTPTFSPLVVHHKALQRPQIRILKEKIGQVELADIAWPRLFRVHAKHEIGHGSEQGRFHHRLVTPIRLQTTTSGRQLVQLGTRVANSYRSSQCDRFLFHSHPRGAPVLTKARPTYNFP